jgi:pyruvate/2-oxoglutarate dehydrogenase complex dihydrolipoamide dehydrogenase (E3) component
VLLRVLGSAAREFRDVLRAATVTHRRLRDQLVAIIVATVSVDLLFAIAAFLLERHSQQTEIKTVVDEDRGVIVGATFTGTDVADWLHAATIALVGEIPVERLWEAVPAFPTRSEIWLNLLEKRETELAREHGGQTHGVAAG